MKPHSGTKSFFLPSLSEAIFLVYVLAIFFGTGSKLLWDDTLYHIRSGEWIVSAGHLPSEDPFSFTSAPFFDRTAHEWLSEVLMAWVHSVGGLAGVAFLYAFQLALAFYFLFKHLKRNTQALAAFILLLIAVKISTLHWLARPHVTSLLLTVIWYRLLDDPGDRHRFKRILLFPPLMMLWVNLHAGFVLGFVLLLAYLAGHLIEAAKAKGDKSKHLQRAKGLGITLIFCVGFALINPHGVRAFGFPFWSLTEKFVMDHVSEFQSPDFHRMPLLALFFTFVLAALGLSSTALTPAESMLIAAFFYQALQSSRYAVLFAVIVTPVLGRLFAAWVTRGSGPLRQGILSISERLNSLDKRPNFFWPGLVTAAILFTVMSGKFRFSPDPAILPVAAVDFLKKERLPGNGFNDDSFGDYLIYAAWPEYKVFVDGRTGMYGEKILNDYLKAMRIQEGWQDVLNDYNIQWIFIPADAPLSRFLRQSGDWQLIYADPRAHILLKRIPAHESLLARYSDETA